MILWSFFWLRMTWLAWLRGWGTFDGDWSVMIWSFARVLRWSLMSLQYATTNKRLYTRSSGFSLKFSLGNLSSIRPNRTSFELSKPSFRYSVFSGLNHGVRVWVSSGTGMDIFNTCILIRIWSPVFSKILRWPCSQAWPMFLIDVKSVLKVLAFYFTRCCT